MVRARKRSECPCESLIGKGVGPSTQISYGPVIGVAVFHQPSDGLSVERAALVAREMLSPDLRRPFGI